MVTGAFAFLHVSSTRAQLFRYPTSRVTNTPLPPPVDDDPSGRSERIRKSVDHILLPGDPVWWGMSEGDFLTLGSVSVRGSTDDIGYNIPDSALAVSIKGRYPSWATFPGESLRQLLTILTQPQAFEATRQLNQLIGSSKVIEFDSAGEVKVRQWKTENSLIDLIKIITPTGPLYVLRYAEH